MLRGSHAQRRIWRTKNCAVVDIYGYTSPLSRARRARCSLALPPPRSRIAHNVQPKLAHKPRVHWLAWPFVLAIRMVTTRRRPAAHGRIQPAQARTQDAEILSPLSNRHQQMPHPYRVLFPGLVKEDACQDKTSAAAAEMVEPPLAEGAGSLLECMRTPASAPPEPMPSTSVAEHPCHSSKTSDEDWPAAAPAAAGQMARPALPDLPEPTKTTQQLSDKIDALHRMLSTGLIELHSALNGLLKHQQDCATLQPPPLLAALPAMATTQPRPSAPLTQSANLASSLSPLVLPHGAQPPIIPSLTSEQKARVLANREAALAKLHAAAAAHVPGPSSASTPLPSPATHDEAHPTPQGSSATTAPSSFNFQRASVLSNSQQARMDANKEAAKRLREDRRRQMPSLPPEILEELGPDPKLARGAAGYHSVHQRGATSAGTTSTCRSGKGATSFSSVQPFNPPRAWR